MFSPHLPCCPPQNTHTAILTRTKIQKNYLIFNHKIIFTSLHHMPLKPFTNKIGTKITNMQCQSFENQVLFKIGLLLWEWSIAFIFQWNANQLKHVYIFIFFSHVPSSSWLKTYKMFYFEHSWGVNNVSKCLNKTTCILLFELSYIWIIQILYCSFLQSPWKTTKKWHYLTVH